ncbi:MAG: nucleotidyltransferase [Candidatus Heimdallarchaeota archaeon]|nr:nucleotidyltransferase [Candidatus Heimdallarchaeota archaeon]
MLKELKALVQVLSELSIPYVIVGGIAVIIHGRIRTTTDIDLIINHNMVNYSDFVEKLQENGFDASINDMKGFEEKVHISIFYKESMFRIDIKGIYQEKDRESIQEAKMISFENMQIQIDTPENIIFNKLIFGSQVDIEDALAVLKKNEQTLDFKKLKSKCEKYGILQEYNNLMNIFEVL